MKNPYKVVQIGKREDGVKIYGVGYKDYPHVGIQKYHMECEACGYCAPQAFTWRGAIKKWSREWQRRFLKKETTTGEDINVPTNGGE